MPAGHKNNDPDARDRVAVLIPCFNEEVTIGSVVEQFRAELPDALVCVFDNNSTDRTVERARAAGARVLHEARRGKGFVIQSAFRHIDTDVYVLVDGDATYPAPAVHSLIAPILTGDADMVVGSRLHAHSQSQFRQINRWANRMVVFILKIVFGVRLTDVLSGYRAFNRRFVKNLPLFGGGFEIETELTIKAVARGYRIVEVPVNLTVRPEGSHSKVNLFRDGMLILTTILTLFRDYKPLTFFGSLGLLFLGGAMIPGISVLAEYFRSGLVPLPAAVLATGLAIWGLILGAIGLLLHSIARRAQEFDYQLQMLGGNLQSQRDKLEQDPG
ncbi:MAG TPA: glycosyltransferase [Chthoniobacterales bacterium]|nr:glycosyltransferase [Chthoniobacterales bacterium]